MKKSLGFIERLWATTLFGQQQKLHTFAGTKLQRSYLHILTWHNKKYTIVSLISVCNIHRLPPQDSTPAYVALSKPRAYITSVKHKLSATLQHFSFLEYTRKKRWWRRNLNCDVKSDVRRIRFSDNKNVCFQSFIHICSSSTWFYYKNNK